MRHEVIVLDVDLRGCYYCDEIKPHKIFEVYDTLEEAVGYNFSSEEDKYYFKTEDTQNTWIKRKHVQVMNKPLIGGKLV